MPDFQLPDLGEGLTEAEVLEWRVAVGDTVVVDQIVVEVETAKASVEVPIPFAGTVSELHVEAGAALQVGAPLISVTPPAPAEPSGFREPGIATALPVESSGSVLIGYGTSEQPRRRRRPHPGGSGSDLPVPATPPGLVPAVVSPLVRMLAHRNGVDLTSVSGSGRDGLIMRKDVEQALDAVARNGSAATHADADEPGQRRIPLRGLRRAAAEKLARSRREIPEATVWVDVDATGLLAARAALNAAEPRHPVSLLALLARFTLVGLRRFPELNGRVEDDAIVIPEAVHLGFAAQTDRGLVVPVVRDAHALDTRALSGAMGVLVEDARRGALAPEQLVGGTVTVNNYGVFGVDGSAAIINHPEVAIIGIGRIIDRAWVVDGELAVRKVTQLTLAFDHRVCDGGTAGGFLRLVADCVEAPVTALGSL